MRLVRVVTSTRSPFSTVSRISWIRSSTCSLAGRTSIGGSIRPVGRMICSTTTPCGLVQFVVGRGGRDIDGLQALRLELLEGQRPVVQGRGQAEAIVDQGLLARAVAAVHGADLGDGDVALVDEEQGILGKVVEQGGRRLARPGGRRESGSSSRSPGRSPSPPSSRYRRGCAARGAGPPAACCAPGNTGSARAAPPGSP